MLRQEFKKGEKARLDAKYNNSSIIEIVCQTKGKLFTRVKSGDHEWDVMTVRLDKILNEQPCERHTETE